MTCLQPSQAFLSAPQNPLSCSRTDRSAAAQSSWNPVKNRSAGDCLLPAGQALTVQVRQAGVLRIVQGRVWITFSHADRLRVPAGDHFRHAGESLRLSAGDAVVIEAWCAGHELQARFRLETASPVSVLTGLAFAGARAAAAVKAAAIKIAAVLQ